MNGDDRKRLDEFQEELQYIKLISIENQKALENLKTNELPHFKKEIKGEIKNLRWLIVLSVGVIAILVSLFGSLMILGL